MSSLTRKYLMALSGLGLVGFVVTHLLGNLTLYLPNPEIFNTYAHKLESMGALLWVAEVGLLGIFLLHIAMAFWIQKNKKEARPVTYASLESKGGPTKATLGSRNMIITGTVLLVFLVLHIKHFKFGPSIADGYVAQSGEHQVRDIHRVVLESFKNPAYSLFYMGVMALLGLHLRHGFWSAFQSLGVLSGKYSKVVYCAGFFIAFLLAAGFFFIPVWLYFDIPGVLK